MPERNQLAPRPTTYKGIAMRSRLEARYAQWLDGLDVTWLYEPKCFADEHGQYLPDFLLRDVYIAGRSRDVYVEVKPTRMAKSDIAQVVERQSIIWTSEPEAVLVLEVAEATCPVVRLPPDLHAPAFIGAWCRTEAGQASITPIIERGWAA